MPREIPKSCDVINKLRILCKRAQSEPIDNAILPQWGQSEYQTHWIFDKGHSLVRTNAVGILLQITSVRRGYGCWTSAWQGFATARIAENDSCAHCSTWSNSLRLMPLRTSWWQSTRTQRKQFHRMRNRALLIRARQNRDAEWN